MCVMLLRYIIHFEIGGRLIFNLVEQGKDLEQLANLPQVGCEGLNELLRTPKSLSITHTTYQNFPTIMVAYTLK